MSEENLYLVKKNDEGQYLVVTNDELIDWYDNPSKLFDSLKKASKWQTALGGHLITLVEEPEKVVLNKEQAEIVEGAKTSKYPATYIYGESMDEGLLMNAYVNGYTVAEKKYLVYKELGGKQRNKYVAQVKRSPVYPGTISWILIDKFINESSAQFTEAEIEHYGLQDCEKEEVTDNA